MLFLMSVRSLGGPRAGLGLSQTSQGCESHVNPGGAV